MTPIRERSNKWQGDVPSNKPTTQSEIERELVALDTKLDEENHYIPRKPNFTRYKRDHCPVCFRAYELIDCELLPTCSHSQNSISYCGICGKSHCGRNH